MVVDENREFLTIRQQMLTLKTRITNKTLRKLATAPWPRPLAPKPSPSDLSSLVLQDSRYPKNYLEFSKFWSKIDQILNYWSMVSQISCFIKTVSLRTLLWFTNMIPGSFRNVFGNWLGLVVGKLVGNCFEHVGGKFWTIRLFFVFQKLRLLLLLYWFPMRKLREVKNKG